MELEMPLACMCAAHFRALSIYKNIFRQVCACTDTHFCNFLFLFRVWGRNYFFHQCEFPMNFTVYLQLSLSLGTDGFLNSLSLLFSKVFLARQHRGLQSTKSQSDVSQICFNETLIRMLAFQFTLWVLSIYPQIQGFSRRPKVYPCQEIHGRIRKDQRNRIDLKKSTHRLPHGPFLLQGDMLSCVLLYPAVKS